MPTIARIIGTGSYLPKKILTNNDLAKFVDTSDEWIVERSGIRQRHMAADGEVTSDLAFQAVSRAVEAAGISAKELDLVIVATTTPDHTFPATATRVQAMLDMGNGAAFDVQAVCGGFVFALAIANNFVRMGQARNVAVIGAETMTRLLDWKDRTTCVLFGDGAGAVILRADSVRSAQPNEIKHGLLSTHIHSNGHLYDLLYVDGGPSWTQTVGHLRMQGREVFRHAVTNLASVVGEALEANGMVHEDIDWLVPHQANMRILQGTAKKLRLDPEQVVITIDRHANTSAASVPLALDTAVRDGRIRDGQIVVMEAMGGGMTWGAALTRW